MNNLFTQKNNYKWYLTAILAIYFFLWIISPTLFSSSFPLDVPEGIYWGKEFQLGYYKHPPFSSWIVYGFYAVFGYPGPYILSQLCIVLTMVFVYKFAKNILSEQKAFYSGIFILGIFYYTYPSLEFNHNIAQMPLWSALIYTFYLAIHKDTWKWWLSFAVLTGIGMLTKYTVAILIFTMVLFSLITPYRKLWLNFKPWCAVIIALMIFSPHIFWLIQHDWLILSYIQSRSHESSNSHQYLTSFKYLLAQLANFLPLLIILLCNKCLSLKYKNIPQSDRYFILFIGLFPGLFLFILNLIFGINIRDMWASPMWCLITLILIAMIPDQKFQKYQIGLAKGLLIWLCITATLMIIYVLFGGNIRNKPSRMDWPQEQLSNTTEQIWTLLSKCKLDNMGGDNWLAILSATDMQNMPSILMHTDIAYSPWINKARLVRYGSFQLWEKGKQPVLPYFNSLEQNPMLIKRSGEFNLKWEKVPTKDPLHIEWTAFIPRTCLK